LHFSNIFLAEEISPETLQLAHRIRNEIIVDLHVFYRSQGFSEAEITLKTWVFPSYEYD
jgi:hypothetical protein